MATASFLGTDLVTKGDWIGVYGADGRRAHTALTVVIPAGITVVAAAAAAFQWVAVSADPRYLLRPDANPSNRFGGGYVGGSHFVDLNYASEYDTWLYAVDGDATNRRMNIQILDRDASLVELSSYNVNFNFNPGVWIGWKINGNIRIQFTQTGGANCVYSGLFWTTAADPDTPSDPVWVTPTTAAGPYGDEVEAEWSESVSPGLGPATSYDLQYWDGFEWWDLATPLMLSYTWDTITREGTGVKLRVRGNVGGLSSAWVESEPFELSGGFALDYWRALSGAIGDLEGLWKGDWPAQGIGAGIDTSGNDRHGDVVMDLFNQPAIITNSNELSIGRDVPDTVGVGDISLFVPDNAIWDATDFTMFMHFNIETASVNSEVMTLSGRAQVRTALGSTTLNLISGGVNTAAGVIPVATDSFLVMSKHGNLTTLFLDGTKIAGHTSTVVATGTTLIFLERMAGTVQGMGFISRALDALEIKWLHTQSLELPNVPPSAPGAFLKPKTVGGPYDHSIAMEWGASIDPEGDTLQYQVEFSPDGGATWTQIFDWAIGTWRTWNTNGIFATIQGKLRVRARDYPYEHVTAWVESETFTILHPRVGISAPTVFVTYRGYSTVGLAVINGLATGYPISHIIVESKWVTEAWDDPDVMTEVVDEAFYETRFFHNVRASLAATGVEPTLLDVRVATVDKGGNQSGWTEFEFKPRWIMIATGGDIDWWCRDHSGNERHGYYAGWVFTAEFLHAEEGSPALNRAPVNVMVKSPMPRTNEPGTQNIAGLGWVPVGGNSINIVQREDLLTENLYSVDWPTDQTGRTFSAFGAFYFGAYLHTDFWSQSWGAAQRRDLLNLGKGLKIFVDSDFGLGVADPEYPTIVVVIGVKLEDTLLRVIDYNTHEDVTNDFAILDDGLLVTTVDTTNRVFQASWSRVYWLITKSGGWDEITYGYAREHAIHTFGFVRDGVSNVNRMYWDDLDPEDHVVDMLLGSGSADRFFTQIFNDGGASANLGDYQMGGFPIEFAVWRDYQLSSAEYNALRVAANNGAETVPEVMATLPTPYFWYRFMDPNIPAKPVLTGGFVP